MANKKKKKRPIENNPVAKHANKFNKAATMRDRKNDYSRKRKNKKADERSAFIFGTTLDIAFYN